MCDGGSPFESWPRHRLYKLHTLQTNSQIHNIYFAQHSYLFRTFQSRYNQAVHVIQRKSPQFINQRMHNNFTQNTFKTLRHVSILSDHHQGALFLAKVILRYSHSIRICKRGVVAAYHVVWECVVEQWLGVRLTTHT